MVYLLLMHIALFLAWFISSFCTLFVSTGSAKLISLTQLPNAIFNNLHQHFFFWHYMLDVMCQPNLEGVNIMRFLEFSPKFNFLKCFELFQILDALPVWIGKKSFHLMIVPTKMIPVRLPTNPVYLLSHSLYWMEHHSHRWLHQPELYLHSSFRNGFVYSESSISFWLSSG